MVFIQYFFIATPSPLNAEPSPRVEVVASFCVAERVVVATIFFNSSPVTPEVAKIPIFCASDKVNLDNIAAFVCVDKPFNELAKAKFPFTPSKIISLNALDVFARLPRSFKCYIS